MIIAIFFLLLLCYSWAFFAGIAPYWFSHYWTTDDAMQQSFPFLKAYIAGVFVNDPVTQAMEGYLTPLHYWLSYGITLFTRDPVMTGHCVMFVQLALTLYFVYFAVRNRAGIAAGLFALTWMLHTRHVMQRMTGGLPRGWAAPVLAGYLWAVLSGSEWRVLIILFFGCLAHPPSTLIAAAAYGMLLLWRTFVGKQDKKPLLRYIALSPLYALLAYLVVQMPPEVGTMASYERASSMIEFSRQGGRFPFVPLLPLFEELRIYAFQSFFSRMYHISSLLEGSVLAGIGIIFVTLLFMRRKEEKTAPLSPALLTYFAAVLIVYLASRAFAFRLYVPDRHLQFPMAIWFVIAFSSGVWIAFRRWGEFASAAAIAVVALLVICGSGNGLYGPANFNTYRYYRGGYVDWLRDNTPQAALIAGHPQHLDPVPLFAERQAYITYETAHPFFDKYYNLVRQRTELSLRAHYARSLKDLYQIVAPEKIDYFVFQREQFYPEKLRKPRYFRPFNDLIMQLVGDDLDHFAYHELPAVVDLKEAPYMPFKDSESAIIDIKKLGEFLKIKSDV
jgi:hypothetical protein